MGRLPSFRKREDPGNARETGLRHYGGFQVCLPKTIAGASGAQSIKKEPVRGGEGKASVISMEPLSEHFVPIL